MTGRNVPHRAWTLERLSVLREFYPTMGAAYVAAMTGHSQQAVKRKAAYLGIRRIRQADDSNFLSVMQREYGCAPARDLADACGVSVNQVYHAARRLGLSRPIGRRSQWNECEDAKLAVLALASSEWAEVAAALGRSVHSVKHRGRLIGVRMEGRPWTDSRRKRFREKRKGHVVSNDTRQKIASANLGRKQPRDAIEKTRAANLGRIRTLETRRLMSQKAKARSREAIRNQQVSRMATLRAKRARQWREQMLQVEVVGIEKLKGVTL